MARSCTPTKYNVVSGDVVTYGWRCAFHHILTRRYRNEAIRDQRLAEHKNGAA